MVVKGRIGAPQFIDFIKLLIHGSRRMVFLIVDGHPAHNARSVTSFIETIKDRFRLFFLPPYSPDLNPDERGWNDAKNNAIDRQVITALEQLHGAVHSHLRFIQKSPIVYALTSITIQQNIYMQEEKKSAISTRNPFGYRQSPLEQERINDLLKIIPQGQTTVLEIGARDGYISNMLTRHFKKVYALDVKKPNLNIRDVVPIKGDVTKLDFPDNSFDTVICTEVLEHIYPELLKNACAEITRVAKYYIIVGVPYKQDIRAGKTTCSSCGTKNPPWGHVNSFSEERLKGLFGNLTLVATTFVGSGMAKTNSASAFLMDLAGNPWGTYSQEESCINCGRKLVLPGNRNVFQKTCSKIAYILNKVQFLLSATHPNWVHMVFRKNTD